MSARNPTFIARFDLRPVTEAEGGVIEVAIDCGHLDEDLAALSEVLRAAVAAGR
ncbi:MAG TPA: hypothetical protein VD866_05300 [Urbifossiella sp.]|nr:hypothetical protein [Urbifossiella sp.]